MATRPVEGEPGWASIYDSYEAISHNTDGTLKISYDGDSPTLNDSETNAMLKSHAYLTQTSGFVTAFKKDTSQTVSGFVGDTDDPAGAGLEVASSQANATSSNAFISFFVAKGKYFEIIKVTDDPTITWTPFVPGGLAPIDQD